MTDPAPALQHTRRKAESFRVQVNATLNVIDGFADAPKPSPDDSLRSLDAFKASVRTQVS
ncbi:hypothetical protein LY56_03362 [Roseinatronobacter thiooxidans]|uniref:Uncharacterized protein n=1 Tax=Roseinatronobacter thiooxidans TaxID=121821 RepID=A0A2W7QDW1_9RHOB|nr:hypothetical protein [Roseinatronobacter thiooxidans]PZX36755.1 hypothetical protein LY56_03362 [Roseinatronobacter thiooxidans]